MVFTMSATAEFGWFRPRRELMVSSGAPKKTVLNHWSVAINTFIMYFQTITFALLKELKASHTEDKGYVVGSEDGMVLLGSASTTEHLASISF